MSALAPNSAPPVAPRRIVALACVALSLLVSREAFAQTAEQRQRAAEAYDRGVSAYLLHDYAEAAQAFEQANRLAPSPVALAQAVRSFGLSGDERRAGSLALRLLEQEGLPTNLREIGENAVARARNRYVRVDVECTGDCTVDVDGAPEPGRRFFVPADRDVMVTATVPGRGAQQRIVHGRPGEVVEVAFEAPASAEPPPPAVEAAPSDPHDLEAGLGEGENPYRISRFRVFSRPRAMFFTVLAPTLIGLGMLTWSSIDTHNSHQDLRRLQMAGSGATEVQLAIAQYAYDRNLRRTKWMGVEAGAFVLATTLIAIFTDWTPHGEDEGPRPTAWVGPGTGGVGLSGRF